MVPSNKYTLFSQRGTSNCQNRGNTLWGGNLWGILKRSWPDLREYQPREGSFERGGTGLPILAPPDGHSLHCTRLKGPLFTQVLPIFCKLPVRHSADF